MVNLRNSKLQNLSIGAPMTKFWCKFGTARHIVRFMNELFIVRFVKELYLGSTHQSSSMILFTVRFMRELYFSSTHKKTKNPNFHGTIHSTFSEGIIHSTFYEGILKELFTVRFMKEF